MGMALLEGDALVYYGVKRIHHRGSPHERLTEGKRVVSELIRDFDPDVLAIEKTFIAKNRSGALLNVFADEIVSLAKRQGLDVVGVGPSTACHAPVGRPPRCSEGSPRS
jgi:Holliday junction resolvasome RuvABC endonuclease subunit